MKVKMKHQLGKVVCGFPGVGKSFMSAERGWADSDSSEFSWVGEGKDKKRNPEFPQNYMFHVIDLILDNPSAVVMCSTHKDVRDALVANKIPFTLVYPSWDCKEEYIERYRTRGSSPTFIALLDKMWTAWIAEMETEDRAVKKVVLRAGEYLKDRV